MLFINWWVFLYLTLLSIYFSGGLLLTFLNQTGFGQVRRIQQDSDQPEFTSFEQIRAACISLAGISLLLAAGISLNQSGFSLFPDLEQNWITTVGGLVLSMVVYDTTFYWIHRLLHRPWFFKRIHYYHHRIRVPGPWTTNSEHLVDGMLINIYWLLGPVLLPIPVIVFIIHRVYDMFTGLLGHSGHEYGSILVLPPSPLVSVTHHDQHHQYFHFNYAVHFTFWDRIMNTLHATHDGSLNNRLRRDGR